MQYYVAPRQVCTVSLFGTKSLFVKLDCLFCSFYYENWSNRVIPFWDCTDSWSCSHLLLFICLSHNNAKTLKVVFNIHCVSYSLIVVICPRPAVCICHCIWHD